MKICMFHCYCQRDAIKTSKKILYLRMNDEHHVAQFFNTAFDNLLIISFVDMKDNTRN
jgi:hypothetical protein